MADVTVTINGHDYVVACKDGEEKHLHFLADYVTKKVSSLVVSFGQIGEARLLLMAALFIADELSEAFSQLGDLKTEVADLKNKVQKAGSGSAKPVAEAMPPSPRSSAMPPAGSKHSPPVSNGPEPLPPNSQHGILPNALRRPTLSERVLPGALGIYSLGPIISSRELSLVRPWLHYMAPTC